MMITFIAHTFSLGVSVLLKAHRPHSRLIFENLVPNSLNS